MKELFKEDFPVKIEELTLRIDSDNYLRVAQDERHGVEEVLIPLHGNGYFDFIDSSGSRFFIFSVGVLEEKIPKSPRLEPIPIEKISLKKLKEEFGNKTKEELELIIMAMLCSDKLSKDLEE